MTMNKTIEPILLLMLIMGLVAAGCEDDEPGLELTKQEWEVVSITEAGTLTPQPAENIYKLEFINDTTYELHLDVNHCVGRYSIPKEGKIDFKRAACTEVCCDSEYAKKMAGMFSDISYYRLDSGFLILSGEGQIR